MTLVLDAGALVAVDRRDRSVGALLRLAQQRQVPVRTSSAVVAQVWRDGARQANLARVLTGVQELALDARAGRSVGTLLSVSRTSDVVDAHIALLTHEGDTVVTSDPDDLALLFSARGIRPSIVTA